MAGLGWNPRKGAPALHRGRPVVIVGPPGVVSTPVRFEDQTVVRVDTQTLEPPPGTQDQEGYVSRDTLGTRKELWQEALRRLAIIKPLLNLGPGQRTRAVVAQRAAESLHRPEQEKVLSASTLYRWIERYEATGEVLSLIRPQRSDAGKHHLDEAVVAVIQEKLKPYLEKKNGHGSRKARRQALHLLFSELMIDIKVACRAQDIGVPSESTVRRVIRALSPQEQAQARGSRGATHGSTPLTGTYKDADYPYSVIQIDHTHLNVMAVDKDGHPICRPYVTFAIDVRTRMVAGMFLSLFPPSTYSVLRCLAQAMLPKTPFLEKLGLDHVWPCYGMIRTVHSDNGPDFDSKMLKDILIRRGIDHHFRLKEYPHWGGHIETLMKTNAGELRPLPGYTGASVQERQDLDLDPDGNACMTLKAIEKWLLNWVCNIYNRRKHSALNDSPFNVFERLTNQVTGSLDLIKGARAEKLDIDFMPFFHAAVTPKGVVHKYVYYYSPELLRLVGVKEHPGSRNSVKRRFHYDWHDMSKVQLYDDQLGKYQEIGFGNRDREPVSYWELKSAREKLKAEAGPIDEEAIFQAVLEGRRIVEEEKKQSRTRRKQAARLEESEQRRAVRVVAEGPVAAEAKREKPSKAEKTEHKVPNKERPMKERIPEANDLPDYPVQVRLVQA